MSNLNHSMSQSLLQVRWPCSKVSTHLVQAEELFAFPLLLSIAKRLQCQEIQQPYCDHETACMMERPRTISPGMVKLVNQDLPEFWLNEMTWLGLLVEAFSVSCNCFRTP